MQAHLIPHLGNSIKQSQHCFNRFLAALVYKDFLGIAHNSFCDSTMTKRYTVLEALGHIFDRDTREEERGQECDSEDASEEEVSEEKVLFEVALCVS